MKKYLLLIVIAIFFSSCSDHLTLVKNNRSDYEILIANEPDSLIVNAASEFQKYIENITGVKIPVVTINEENKRKNKVLVGAYPEGDSYNVHNVFYRIDENNLVIGGGSPLSILYSVYTFLEQELKCMFLDPDAEIIPRQKRLSISEGTNFDYTPEIETRTVHSILFYDKHDFADKRKVSTEAFPGYVPNARVHTFHRFMPGSAFYNEHPEYFALREGKRLTTQLCLSNPDVLEIISDSVKAYFDRNPG